MDNCPYCGTKLQETSWGRKFCPNHGIIEEPSEMGDEEREAPSYIG